MLLDAVGQTSSTVYSAANQVVSTTDALGRVTKFEYDAAGVPSACPEDIFERFMNGLSSESRLATAS